MKRSLFFVLVLMMVGVLALSACGGGGAATEAGEEVDVPAPYTGKTNPHDGQADAAAAGKTLFETNCASCHGVTGKGDGPAGTALDPKAADLAAATNVGDDFLFWRISEGGGMEPFNSSMPAFKGVLSEDEIWQVVTHIREDLQ